MQLSGIFLSNNSLIGALPDSWGSLSQVCVSMTLHMHYFLHTKACFLPRLPYCMHLLQAEPQCCHAACGNRIRDLLVIALNQHLKGGQSDCARDSTRVCMKVLTHSVSYGAAAEPAVCQQQHHHWDLALLMEHLDSGKHCHKRLEHAVMCVKAKLKHSGRGQQHVKAQA